MNARLGSRKVLYYFDSAATVADTSLLSLNLLLGNTSNTYTFQQVTDVPNLYRSESFLLTQAGQYEAVFRYGGQVLTSGYVQADMYPLSDYPLLVASRVKRPGTAGSNVTMQVVNNAGVATSPIPATYNAGTAAYEAPYTFPTVGDYAVVWLVDTVPVAADPVFIDLPNGREIVRFVAAAWSGNGGTPHTNTTIVVSDQGGVQVAQGVTDQAGEWQVALPPGDYVASMFRTGRVFSINNINFTVAIGATATAYNVHLMSEYQEVTVTPPAAVAPLCTIYADLYRMDGQPLRNANVRIALVHRPQLFSGTSVFDTDLSLKTDTNGHVEFRIVQGVQIEVSIAPLSLRRTITVPSGLAAQSPVNLMTLMAEAPDPFTIVVPNIQSASKRSLT